jgi:ankyrin repeat protein
MMESKYASDVVGNVFQKRPLTDAGGVFPPILGGIEAIREVIEMVPQEDLQATDLHGRSPLFMATDLQKEPFGLALLLHAADHLSIPRRQFTNARDKSGQTILGIAILRCCSLEYIEALIDYGAEVDPETLMEMAFTPLQIASWLGYSGIVDLLLGHGAQPGRIWPGSKTPEELAQEAGHNDIVDKLQSHGAG